METFDFQLTLLSPAFIAGGMEEIASTQLKDKKGNTPQHRKIGMNGDGLRIPSLRGVLRFWYRAKEGIADTKKLSINEALIFGDTIRGQGLRFIPLVQSKWVPKKIGGEKNKIKGGDSMAYLGYGPLNYVSKDIGVSSYNKSSFRDAIPEGTTFTFRAIGNDQQIEELKKCLLLIHLFGSIGSRSRRAWGSLAVSGDFIPSFDNGQPVNEWFGNCLSNIWPDEDKPSQRTNLPDFSAFCANTRICLSKPHNSYQQVMDDFHNQFKKVRIYNPFNPSQSHKIARDDHAWEVNDSNPKTKDIQNVPLRLAFGMPYHPVSRDKKKPWIVNWEIEYGGYYSVKPGEIEKIDRRASPLFLKVFIGPDQKYYGVSLFLKARYFSKKNAKIGKNEHGKHLPFPGWKAIEAFMANNDWQAISLP